MSDNTEAVVETPVVVTEAPVEATETAAISPVVASNEAKPVVVEEERVSKKFAALARKEQALKSREAKLNEIESRVSKFEEIKSKAANDPFAVLESLGMDRKTAIAEIAKRLNEAPPDPTTTKIEQLSSTVDQLLKDKKTLEAQELVRAKETAVNNSIKPFIASNTTKFPLISALGVEHEVVDYLEIKYNENPNKPMSIEQASKDIESWLDKNLDKLPVSMIKKVVSNPVYAAKLGLTPSEVKEVVKEAEKQEETKKVTSKTLKKKRSTAASAVKSIEFKPVTSNSQIRQRKQELLQKYFPKDK